MTNEPFKDLKSIAIPAERVAVNYQQAEGKQNYTLKINDLDHVPDILAFNGLSKLDLAVSDKITLEVDTQAHLPEGHNAMRLKLSDAQGHQHSLTVIDATSIDYTSVPAPQGPRQR